MICGKKGTPIYPSAILGNIEVLPITFLTSCWRLLNGGVSLETNPIKKIVNKQKEVYEFPIKIGDQKIIKDEDLFLLLSMMRGWAVRGNGHRLSSIQGVYGKTGTPGVNQGAVCLCATKKEYIMYIGICREKDEPLGENV